MLQNNRLECGEFIVAGHYLPIEIVLLFGVNDKYPNECWSLRFYLDIKENIVKNKILEKNKNELNSNTINRAISLKIMYATMKCSRNLKNNSKCRIGIETLSNDMKDDFITDFNFNFKNFKKRNCQIITMDFINQEIFEQIFGSDDIEILRPLHQIEIIANHSFDNNYKLSQNKKKEWIKSCHILQGIKFL
ncbi:hypothetical protein RFI_20768 [Reticulomyxa filosa]|uniref:Uncharacterized protein n=1 Tax=Reticulomyxa filosa TaxID=46433 RepID=X6MRD5_RETFI|nr:hypothetical protein RFI_20768 [Reticulomyxa filosa]|eukprot:ETO16573.1 hypothetical protein RFI_20768 [Reticulomyxa filosa]